MKRLCFFMQCVGLTMFLVGGAAMDGNNQAISLCVMVVGGILLFLFFRLERTLYFGEEFPMYYRLERAGLIIDTDEWKEVQEEKMLRLMEEEGEADAGPKTDHGQAI